MDGNSLYKEKIVWHRLSKEEIAIRYCLCERVNSLAWSLKVYAFCDEKRNIVAIYSLQRFKLHKQSPKRMLLFTNDMRFLFAKLTEKGV